MDLSIITDSTDSMSHCSNPPGQSSHNSPNPTVQQGSTISAQFDQSSTLQNPPSTGSRHLEVHVPVPPLEEQFTDFPNIPSVNPPIDPQELHFTDEDPFTLMETEVMNDPTFHRMFGMFRASNRELQNRLFDHICQTPVPTPM